MRENNDENSVLNMGDKLAFIIGFIALLVGLYSLNSPIKDLQIDILIGTYSLTNLLEVFLALLGISLYLYVLNSMRFDFKFILGIKWLKYLETTGHVFYLLALFVYPFILLVLYVMNICIEWIGQYVDISIHINFPREVIVAIISIAATIFTFYVTAQQVRNTIKTFVKISTEKDADASEILRNYMKKKEFEYVPIVLYERLSDKLKSTLVKEYGYDVSKFNLRQLSELAYNSKKLTEEDIGFLNALREIRNLVAHARYPRQMTAQEVTNLIERTDAIMKKLG